MEKKKKTILHPRDKKKCADYIEIECTDLINQTHLKPVVVWQARPRFRPSLRVVLLFKALLKTLALIGGELWPTRGAEGTTLA